MSGLQRDLGAGTATEEPYHIPANLLEGNRRLKEIRIETWVMPSGHEIQLPEGMFKANPALERVEISYPRTFIEKKTFSHLDNLKELSLLNSSSLDPSQDTNAGHLGEITPVQGNQVRRNKSLSVSVGRANRRIEETSRIPADPSQINRILTTAIIGRGP